mmetsp:Transcript_102310/g.329894  ORF Transcript_102310/g.329894 Transcript_102310/m.329894 type:complete len:262 (+) Transcript_102310:499-1284(+)
MLEVHLHALPLDSHHPAQEPRVGGRAPHQHGGAQGQAGRRATGVLHPDHLQDLGATTLLDAVLHLDPACVAVHNHALDECVCTFAPNRHGHAHGHLLVRLRRRRAGGVAIQVPWQEIQGLHRQRVHCLLAGHLSQCLLGLHAVELKHGLLRHAPRRNQRPCCGLCPPQASCRRFPVHDLRPEEVILCGLGAHHVGGGLLRLCPEGFHGGLAMHLHRSPPWHSAVPINAAPWTPRRLGHVAALNHRSGIAACLGQPVLLLLA